MQHTEDTERKEGSRLHVGVTPYMIVKIELFEASPLGDGRICPIEDINDAKRPVFPQEHQDVRVGDFLIVPIWEGQAAFSRGY